MRRQARTCRRRIRLNGVALVQITLLIEFLQQIPQRLNILIIIGDIRVIEVHPIAHLLRQIRPFLGVLHHLLAASGVVLVHANLLTDILFGNPKHLLHAQLHGQTMRIPARLALHLIPLHRLVAAEGIFYRTRQHMVNTRHAVRRRRTLKEQKRRAPLACLYTLPEQVFLLPCCQHLAAQLRQIQLLILSKLLHNLYVWTSWKCGLRAAPEKTYYFCTDESNLSTPSLCREGWGGSSPSS